MGVKKYLVLIHVGHTILNAKSFLERYSEGIRIGAIYLKIVQKIRVAQVGDLNWKVFDQWPPSIYWIALKASRLHFFTEAQKRLKISMNFKLRKWKHPTGKLDLWLLWNFPMVLSYSLIQKQSKKFIQKVVTLIKPLRWRSRQSFLHRLESFLRHTYLICKN